MTALSAHRKVWRSKKEKDEENRKRAGTPGGGPRRLPNLIGLGGDSKRLWVSWRHAVLAVSEL